MKEYYDHPYAALDRDDEQGSPLSSNETSSKSSNLRLKHVLFIALSILIAFALFGAGLLFGLEFGRSCSREGQMQHSEISWCKNISNIRRPDCITSIIYTDMQSSKSPRADSIALDKIRWVLVFYQ